MSNDEVIALQKVCTSRRVARDSQRFILRLGYDARMIGALVIATIPIWESNIVSTLEQMQWKIA